MVAPDTVDQAAKSLEHFIVEVSISRKNNAILIISQDVMLLTIPDPMLEMECKIIFQLHYTGTRIYRQP